MWSMKRMKLDESKFVREDGQSSQEEDPVNRARYGDNRRFDKGVPVACDCGLNVVVGTAKSTEGREERFFMCGYDLYTGLREGCGFKRAVEKALIDEVAVIKAEKAELQVMADETKQKMGEDRGTLAWMQVQFEEMVAAHRTLEDYDGELGETQVEVAQLRDKQQSLERMVHATRKEVEMIKQERDSTGKALEESMEQKIVIITRKLGQLTEEVKDLARKYE